MKTFKMKRVLHVVGAMNKGGTETMLMNLYRNIDRDKIQFDFISYSNEEAYYDKEINRLGGKIIRLSPPNTIGFRNAISEMVNAIKNNGPYDVVHAHTLFNSGIAMIAAKKCGIEKRISHSHTTLDNDKNFIRKAYISAMRYIINKNSTKLLACSKEAGKYLFGEKYVSSDKYLYFQNLINYDELLDCPSEEVKKFKEENDLNNSLVIGHIGTFKESKNHRLLLKITKEMVKRNIDVKLLLVGDGSLKEEFKTISKEYGISDKVIFAGIREDINVMLHSMDVFVFPSIYEGLGLVLLEAQAAGLSCLVSEAIQPEADLGLGLFDRLNLENSIEKWCDRIELLSNKKESSIEKIEKAFDNKGYSTNSCIDKMMKVYNN